MPRAATTSLKLGSELKERVKNLAKSRRRTAHWIMREAVEQYVSREEKRQRFHQDALAAWNEYQATGLHVTAEEADAWLAKLSSLMPADSGEDDFFANRSVGELASKQKVKSKRDLSSLAGGIPDDEDFGGLLKKT